MKTTKTFVLMLLCASMSMMNAYSQLKWIQTPKSDPQLKSIDKLLQPIDASVRVLSCEYDSFKVKNISQITNDHSQKWSYTLSQTKGKQYIDFILVLQPKEDCSIESGVAVAFDLNSWRTDNYVMIPASVYNANRQRTVNRKYASGLDRSDLYKKDLPLTSVPIPQLSPIDGDKSLLEVNSSNVTTPVVCVWDKSKKRALMVFAQQGIKVGDIVLDNAFIVEENSDRTKASIVISAPGVRERKPEFIGFSKSPDKGVKFKKSDKIKLKFRVYEFSAENIPALFDRFTTERKSVTGLNSPRKQMPFSEIFKLMTHNIDKRYFVNDQFEFYGPENQRWISFGWVGGLMNTYPMLYMGDAEHRRRVVSTFDFAFDKGQGESGYFYGALGDNGVPFGREGYDEDPCITLTRKNSDVLYWLLKHYKLLDAQGNGTVVTDYWKKNTKRLADAFVKTWKKEGQWGNFIHNKTGEIVVYNTSSGVMTIGALALASQFYNDPEYLNVAIEAANMYYNDHFVKTGMTTGACADILQNADSESAVSLMTSLMELYEVTGDIKWLYKSRDLANLTASWTVSFDYELPHYTQYAKLGAKFTGAIWASTQNKHGAPGSCTSSCDALFKIYRATGEVKYAELMRDITHAYVEAIQPDGKINERLTYCDADSRGERLDGWSTGWNELNGALMAIELPGIYVNTTTALLYVFDHVDAKIVGKEEGKIKIEIYNPTKYDAAVSVFAETSKQAKTPLGFSAISNAPRVNVKSGQRIEYILE